MDSPLVVLIREAYAEGVREENWKIERIRGEITRFVPDSRGLLTHLVGFGFLYLVGSNILWWKRLISLVSLFIWGLPRCIGI